MFAQTKRGYGGVPHKEGTMSFWGALASRLAPKNLVPTELVLGRRGACTEKSAVNNRKIATKHYVRISKLQDLAYFLSCLLFEQTYSFDKTVTVIHIKLPRTGSAPRL